VTDGNSTFVRRPAEDMLPYQRLLGDAMRHSAELFTRQDLLNTIETKAERLKKAWRKGITMSDTPRPTETQAWQALNAHYEEIKGAHLGQLFAEEAVASHFVAVSTNALIRRYRKYKGEPSWK
jgi:hypothetical protein